MFGGVGGLGVVEGSLGPGSLKSISSATRRACACSVAGRKTLYV